MTLTFAWLGATWTPLGMFALFPLWAVMLVRWTIFSPSAFTLELPTL